MKPMHYESILKDIRGAIGAIQSLMIGNDREYNSTTALNACESAYDKICKLNEQEDWSSVTEGLPQDDEQDYLVYSTITHVYEKVDLAKLEQMVNNLAKTYKITHWRECPDVPVAITKLQIMPFDPNKGVAVLVDGDKQRAVGELKGYTIYKAPSLKTPNQEILFTEYFAFSTQIGTQTRDNNSRHIELITDAVTHIWGDSGIDEVFDLLG